MDFVSGPDFPTGGVLVDNRETIAHAYATGRGSFRLRAKIEVERREGRGLAPAGQRNPLWRAEGQADRADRGPDRAEEAADPGRRARRERREGADRAGAEVADGRSGAAGGEPLQADRAGGALPAEPERARQDADAGRDEPEAGAARLARVPDRGAGPAVDDADREDRRPAGAARRVPGRVPQPRPGDRDHPHRGRAQGGDDRRVHADRPAGRGDPQHAAAAACAARGDGDRQGAGGAGEGAGGAGRAGREPDQAAQPAEEGPGGAEARLMRATSGGRW